MAQYSDRTQLELRKFSDALDALIEAAGEDEDRKSRDSLLLRYVFTFEMAWQSMHRILQERGDQETPRVAFATLETAYKVSLIHDPDLWRKLRDARNDVVHAYDEEHAIVLAALVRSKALPAFVELRDMLSKNMA